MALVYSFSAHQRKRRVEMSKMSNHIVRQREAGIKEDLTEEIKLVDGAVSWVALDIYMGKARGRNKGRPDIRGEKKLARELEKAWDKIKRSVKDDI